MAIPALGTVEPLTSGQGDSCGGKGFCGSDGSCLCDVRPVNALFGGASSSKDPRFKSVGSAAEGPM